MLKLLIPKSDGVYYIVLPCNQNTKNVRKKAYGTRIKLNLLGIRELMRKGGGGMGLNNHSVERY